MSKTNKGRIPTPQELMWKTEIIKFDSQAWEIDNPGYPDPLCDPEDWTPPPQCWRGLEEYLYVDAKAEQTYEKRMKSHFEYENMR